MPMSGGVRDALPASHHTPLPEVLVFNSLITQAGPAATTAVNEADVTPTGQSRRSRLVSMLGRGRTRLVTGGLVAAAALSAAALGPVASAGATSLRAYPTFECY